MTGTLYIDNLYMSSHYSVIKAWKTFYQKHSLCLLKIEISFYPAVLDIINA